MGSSLSQETTKKDETCNICNIRTVYLDYKMCMLCLKKIGKRLDSSSCLKCDKITQDTLKCLHRCCKDCKGKSEDCVACRIICSYCKKNLIGPHKHKCRTHKSCDLCYENLVKHGNNCFIGDGNLSPYTCVECKEFNIKIQMFCQQPTHGYCTKCVSKGKDSCEKCQKCVNCSNSTINAFKLPCAHFLCETCQSAKATCALCNPPTKCANCLVSVIGEKRFLCGHSACEVCLEDQICKLCSGQCDGCKMILYDVTTLECRHSLCENCKSIGICPLCTICENCGYLKNCFIAECGHIICTDCRYFNICLNCEFVKGATVCNECHKETDGCLMFSCGEHFACISCKGLDFCKVCMKKCDFCSGVDLKFDEFQCGCFYCSKCKKNGVSYCKTCKKCAGCGVRKKCQIGECGHLLCDECIGINELCRMCKDTEFVECPNCKRKNAALLYECGHSTCEECYSAFDCIECKKVKYLASPLAVCGQCDLDAVSVSEGNFYCKVHYESHPLEKSPYFSLGPNLEFKQKLVDRINESIEISKKFSINVVQLTSEALKKINESSCKILKLLEKNTQNLIKIKQKLICENLISEENYENLSKRFKPRIFTDELKFQSRVKKICDFISEDLITESLEDKFFMYFSPKSQKVESISLDKLLKKELDLDVKVGIQSQATRLDSSFYFVNGGLCNSNTSETYLLDLFRNKKIRLKRSGFPMAGGACALIFPKVYLFEKVCVAYDLQLCQWEKISDIPFSINGGSSTVLSSKIMLTGSNLPKLLMYNTVSNEYITMSELYHNNKILCEEYLLIHEIGIFKVDSENKIYALGGPCNIGTSPWIISYSAKKQDFFYFMNTDETLIRFDTRTFTTNLIEI